MSTARQLNFVAREIDVHHVSYIAFFQGPSQQQQPQPIQRPNIGEASEIQQFPLAQHVGQRLRNNPTNYPHDWTNELPTSDDQRLRRRTLPAFYALPYPREGRRKAPDGFFGRLRPPCFIDADPGVRIEVYQDNVDAHRVHKLEEKTLDNVQDEDKSRTQQRNEMDDDDDWETLQKDIRAYMSNEAVTEGETHDGMTDVDNDVKEEEREYDETCAQVSEHDDTVHKAELTNVKENLIQNDGKIYVPDALKLHDQEETEQDNDTDSRNDPQSRTENDYNTYDSNDISYFANNLPVTDRETHDGMTDVDNEVEEEEREYGETCAQVSGHDDTVHKAELTNVKENLIQNHGKIYVPDALKPHDRKETKHDNGTHSSNDSQTHTENEHMTYDCNDISHNETKIAGDDAKDIHKCDVEQIERHTGDNEIGSTNDISSFYTESYTNENDCKRVGRIMRLIKFLFCCACKDDD